MAMPAAPLTRHILTGGIASINVGPDEVPFDAHIELLCNRSPFFDRALKGRFLESDTKIIPLPDDHPDTFAQFLSWMYSGIIFQTVKHPTWIALSSLWVMADKFGVPALQNKVIGYFPEKHASRGVNHNVDTPTLEFIYEYTNSGSPLRRMIADICAWGMSMESFEKHKQDMPAEFLEDFVLALMKKNKDTGSALFESYLPAYHVALEMPKSSENAADKAGPSDVDTPTRASPTQMSTRQLASPRSRARGRASTPRSHADSPASVDAQAGSLGKMSTSDAREPQV